MQATPLKVDSIQGGSCESYSPDLVVASREEESCLQVLHTAQIVQRYATRKASGRRHRKATRGRILHRRIARLCRRSPL